MNGYAFRGSNSVIFIAASHKVIKGGHLIKEKKMLPLQQIHSLRVDRILGKFHPPGKKKRKSRKLCPFQNMKKIEVYLYTLRIGRKMEHRDSKVQYRLT